MEKRLLILKKVLYIKAILTIFLWGIPSLIAPPALLQLFGLPTADLTFIRIFGAVVIAMGVAYWFAYKDPLRNLAIIWMGVLDNGLATLVIILLGITVGVSWYLWLSTIMIFFFFLAFLILVPKSDIYKKPA